MKDLLRVLNRVSIEVKQIDGSNLSPALCNDIEETISKTDELEKIDFSFIESALNFCWNDAHGNLQRKDLGDIERKNYEYQLKKSKEQMVLIDKLNLNI